MEVKIGLVQVLSAPEPMKNINAIQEYARTGKQQGCHALCFPEAFLTGYAPKEVSNRALSVKETIIKQISELAMEQGMDLLIGFMEQEREHYYLTQGVFCADGRMEFYRKTHLGQREKQVFSAGDELKLFRLSCGVRFGFQICVENHFPEITQTLSLKGAEIIFSPYAVPGTAEKRREVWRKIVPARSYDNRVYMACCNLWEEGRFGGGCLATNPQGEIIASAFGQERELVTFVCDTKQVEQYHQWDASMKYRYYPRYRRPELYD